MAYSPALAKRLEGRLYTDQGHLHYILEVNPHTATARVSRRTDTLQVVDVPIAEVIEHVSASTYLTLDNLNSPRAAQRVIETNGEWFFLAREGLQGPFANREAAEQAMAKFIIGVQKHRRPGSR